jgi:hypothetical protein
MVSGGMAQGLRRGGSAPWLTCIVDVKAVQSPGPDGTLLSVGKQGISAQAWTLLRPWYGYRCSRQTMRDDW